MVRGNTSAPLSGAADLEAPVQAIRERAESDLREIFLEETLADTAGRRRSSSSGTDARGRSTSKGAGQVSGRPRCCRLCARRQARPHPSASRWRVHFSANPTFGSAARRCNAWYALGEQAVEDGRHAEARQHFERAILVDPVGQPAAMAHVALGRLMAKQDGSKFPDAFACFERALELSPRMPMAHYRAGRLLWQHRRSLEAVAHFRAALDFSAGNAPFRSKVRRALTLALLDTGQAEEAKRLAQAEAAETEAAMAMNRVTLAFFDNQMEEDFTASRSADKAWTTRLVLILALIQMSVPLVTFVRDTQPTKPIYFSLYTGGIVVCLLSLAGTFHRRFWAVKGFCCVLSIAAIIGIQLANLILLLKDSEKSWEDLPMRGELIQAIMTFHLHFCLLFICPQLFGLSWITMSSAVLCLLFVLICMWSTLPAAVIFFPVLWVCTLLLLVVVISNWVELQERNNFKASRMLSAKHEMLAQYESFWRSADAVRHESDLASAEARTALKCRNELTAFIFHEIRNPLNACAGAVQMMEQGGSLTEDGRRWASVAKKSTLAMDSVLNDVLLLSKMEEGKFALPSEKMSVSGLIEEVVFMFSGQAKAAGVELVATISDNVYAADAVVGCKRRLAEVLSNFVSNSLKAVSSPIRQDSSASNVRAKRITVGVRRLNEDIDSASVGSSTCDDTVGAELEFIVSDTGRGLSADQLHMAASPVPYATLADSSQSKQQSTGLGLVISKQLIEAHGGQMIVSSAGLGQGSSFGFRANFPMASSTADASKGITTASAQNEVNREQRQFSSSRSGGGGGGAGFDIIRVLAVDDDELNVSIIQDMLKSEGMLCDTATDGAEALEIINENPDYYSCVVTDVIMPVMNGRVLSRRLRQQHQHDVAVWEQGQSCTTCPSALPVIGLSGCCTPADKEQSLEAGMVAVLSKPANLPTLVAAVRQAYRPSAIAVYNDADDVNDL